LSKRCRPCRRRWRRVRSAPANRSSARVRPSLVRSRVKSVGGADHRFMPAAGAGSRRDGGLSLARCITRSTAGWQSTILRRAGINELAIYYNARVRRTRHRHGTGHANRIARLSQQRCCRKPWRCMTCRQSKRWRASFTRAICGTSARRWWRYMRGSAHHGYVPAGPYRELHLFWRELEVPDDAFRNIVIEMQIPYCTGRQSAVAAQKTIAWFSCPKTQRERPLAQHREFAGAARGARAAAFRTAIGLLGFRQGHQPKARNMDKAPAFHPDPSSSQY